jgi:hypothetical protein
MSETEQWRVDMVNDAAAIGMALMNLTRYRVNMTSEEKQRFSRLGMAATTVLDEMVRMVDPSVFEKDEEE